MQLDPVSSIPEQSRIDTTQARSAACFLLSKKTQMIRMIMVG